MLLKLGRLIKGLVIILVIVRRRMVTETAHHQCQTQAPNPVTLFQILPAVVFFE
jgi:hypothetical protein